ncbi:MAG: ABC transporter permease [Candidatus Eiseniibacteriota bacterium]|nr:MAG: ABC transporter permease [Candidatus Eisenbacteria bacterium]
MIGAHTIGQRVLEGIEQVGSVSLFFMRVLRAVPGFWRKGHLLFEQMVAIGVESIPLVLVTSIFTGGVAAVQAAYQFQDYVPMRYLGSVIGKSVVIELGPVLTALVVAGRVGASIAAELGTMRVTEQIDALETIGISPIRFLAVPRLLAGMIMLPLITVFSDFLAIGGAYVVALLSLDVATNTFMEGLRLFFHLRDVFGGLVKSLFFGVVITMMGCYFGFNAEGGAEGVGRATTRAVVASCLLILILDYMLASLLFRVIFV